jgi:hypothetical protein
MASDARFDAQNGAFWAMLEDQEWPRDNFCDTKPDRIVSFAVLPKKVTEKVSLPHEKRLPWRIR